MQNVKGDPAFGDAQEKELRRLVEALRGLIEHSVSLNAPADRLSALAERIEALREEIASLSDNRPLAHFRRPENAELNPVLPYSPVTGHFNPISPPLHLRDEGERIVGDCTFGRAFEGPPDTVHGGWVTAMHDQLLGLCTVVRGMGGPTATITVNLKRPTPLDRKVTVESWIDRVEDRKVWVKGTCTLDGEHLNDSIGLFIRLKGAPKARNV